MEYSNEELLKMYYHLAKGRIFTEKMHEAVQAGHIRSSFHTPYGEEALGVGIMSALRDTDWISGNHRFQTGCLMRLDNYQMICEIFGKKDGIQHGSAFDFHWSDFKDKRMVMPIGTLGAKTPMYTGFAWQLKRQGKDEVIVIVNGEGGTSEGPTYEAWNLAALKKAPVVYVIDNNRWAMTVPIERQCVDPVVSNRAKPFGLSTQVVDGTDVLAIREATEIALEKARNGEPNVLEFDTVRWGAHFFGQQDKYRFDKEQVEEAKKNRDCVKLYEDYLKDKNLIDDAYIEKTKAEITKELEDLIARAIACEYTTKEDIYRKEFIYGTPETGGDL